MSLFACTPPPYVIFCHKFCVPPVASFLNSPLHVLHSAFKSGVKATDWSADLSNVEKWSFIKNAKQIAVLVQKFQECYSLKYQVAHCASSLSPRTMVSD